MSLQRDIVVKRLAVPRVPRSGKCDELLDMFGISKRHVLAAVEEVASL